MSEDAKDARERESFFRMVTKYERTINRDPGEDRLTQIFASLCLYLDDFAGPLLSDLIRNSVRGGSLSRSQEDFVNGIREEAIRRVDTQQHRESGRLDLILEFEAGSVVIEVKGPSKSQLTPDQPTKYQREDEIVCLLAPGGYFVDEKQRPDAFIHVSWQMLGERVKAWCGSLRTPSGVWLVEQFVAYLKEEGLMNEAISKANGGGTEFDELLRSLDLGGKLEAFLEEVDRQVSDAMNAHRWQPRATANTPKEGTPRTKTWPARLRNWSPPDQLPDDPESGKRRQLWTETDEQNDLEWRIGGSPGKPRSSVELSAGLVFRPKGSRPEILVNPESKDLKGELERLEEDLGLTLTTDEVDTYEPWFISTASLSEVLKEARSAETEFDTQARFVANWIIERLHAAGKAAGLVSPDDESWVVK